MPPGAVHTNSERWSADELSERWSLLADDLALLAGRVGAGKLGFAVQLAFWRQHGRFPDEEADVAPAVIAHLAARNCHFNGLRNGFAQLSTASARQAKTL
jgi:Domain of unknown function (DUF4158)